MNRFVPSKYRSLGPLLCDLQGDFMAKDDLTEENYKIHIFNFRNKEAGIGSRENILCQYRIYNDEGVLEEEVYEASYKKLLTLLEYQAFLDKEKAEIEEEESEKVKVKIKKKKTKRKEKKK